MIEPIYDPHFISLKLYNTETREKVLFAPLHNDTVKLYTCGPTVYNYAHIGNFRTYIFEDLLRRTLKFFGYQVIQVMNLTDVDDKTIRGAIEKNVSLAEFTQTFKDAFFADISTLRIEPAEHYPSATDYIPNMIQLIQTLLASGIAYTGGDGSVYFAINKFPRYGCLSHFNASELIAGASERLDVDEYEKSNLSDFVLWKAYDPARDGSIFWESPFGKGRPGWHIECSAMAMEILGETIDIHVGGVDNMFPHHENEIAQSEACTGKRFVNLWMHSEHLLADGKKMSKSQGNFYRLRDLLEKGFSGRQVRCMLIQTHYKTQLNFTLQGLEAVKHTLQRLDDFILRLQELQNSGCTLETKGYMAPLLERSFREFASAMGDDLNISVAFASIFELVREINALCDKNQINSTEAKYCLQLLKRYDAVLDIMCFESVAETIPAALQEALDQRVQARKDKNWALSDQLRDFIEKGGYVIEDTPQGPRLKKGEMTNG